MSEQAFFQLPSRWPAGPADPRVLHAGHTPQGSVTIEVDVPADCSWLEGHFPGRPVLPGVVQVRWALQLAGQVWPNLDSVVALNNVKFLNPVLPPVRLRLELQWNAETARLDFAWHQDTQRCSQGRVVFT